MADWLKRIKILDAFLDLIKKHWALVLAIIAGLGTNGVHAWHGHDLQTQVEAEQAASKIYADIVAVSLGASVPPSKQILIRYDDADILKRLIWLEEKH